LDDNGRQIRSMASIAGDSVIVSIKRALACDGVR